MLKRGVSPVIATVLLVVITLVAVAILASFVIPFVKKNLGSQECFDVLGHLKFESSNYVCYLSGTDNRTGFSVRADDDNLIGFRAIFYAGGSSEPAEILNGTDGTTLNPQVFMLGGSSFLAMPQKGGVRTYVVHGVYEKVELYPILKSGTTCDQSDSIELSRCLDSDVITALKNS
jgi:flagellin-like protein